MDTCKIPDGRIVKVGDTLAMRSGNYPISEIRDCQVPTSICMTGCPTRKKIVLKPNRVGPLCMTERLIRLLIIEPTPCSINKCSEV